MRYKELVAPMLLMCVASFALDSVIASTGQKIPFTPEDVDLIVSLLNQVKALNVTPTASDMRTLHWDEDLAKFSEDWTMKCEYNYMEDTSTSLWSAAGQSFFLASAEWSENFHYSAVLGWLGEKDVFTYSNGSCSDKCLDYLQLSYSKSYKVGCAATFCSLLDSPTTGDAYTDATYYMCSFFPMAPTTPGYQPYKAGPACTECRDPTDTCSDFKLCTNPERQKPFGEIQKYIEDDEKRGGGGDDSSAGGEGGENEGGDADEGTGMGNMQMIIAGVTGGLGVFGIVGSIIKLCKGSAVEPSAPEIPEAPPEPPQAPVDPEETVTNGKAPTNPVDADEAEAEPEG